MKPHFRLRIRYVRDDIVGGIHEVWRVSRELSQKLGLVVNTADYPTAKHAIEALPLAGMCDTRWP